MDLKPRRIVPLVLLFNAIWLPATVFADPPEQLSDADRATQQQMELQLKKAREIDKQREADRQARLLEKQAAAKTVRAVAPGPPQELPEERRARALREAEARREVRAADRVRDRERAAARRAR